METNRLPSAVPPPSSLDSAGGMGNFQGRSVPLVDGMEMSNSESGVAEKDQEVAAAQSVIVSNDAYSYLKAGLASDGSSFSSTSTREEPDPEAGQTTSAGLTGLAAETSRAMESRGAVMAPSAKDATSNSGDSNFRSLPLVEHQCKRRGSPEIDSSVESSSNDDIAMGVLNHIFGVAQFAADAHDSSEAEDSSVSSTLSASWRRNPQEGSDASMLAKHAIEENAVIVDTANHPQESGSTSTPGGSTQGITHADAARAAIFRKSNEANTPIRLKKAPTEYGENAILPSASPKHPATFFGK